MHRQNVEGRDEDRLCSLGIYEHRENQEKFTGKKTRRRKIYREEGYRVAKNGEITEEDTKIERPRRGYGEGM